MGFLDFLNKKNESASEDIELQEANARSETRIKMNISFSPLRLSAGKESKIKMIVKIKNESNTPMLISVDALLSKKDLIGFDSACVSKHSEKKIGEIKAGETKEAVFDICSSNQTKQGNYNVGVNVYSHYLDYDKVINYVKRVISLRAA
ncbi:MAG: hypothetical protein AABX38_00850 [Candidatus Micrarchaeota archaeon]